MGAFLITTNEIYVISPDYHTEGLSEPIAAFADRQSADAAMKLLSTAAVSYKLSVVPVYPGGFAAAEKRVANLSLADQLARNFYTGSTDWLTA